MIIKILKQLGRRMDIDSEKFNSEVENIKNQTAKEYIKWHIKMH